MIKIIIELYNFTVVFFFLVKELSYWSIPISSIHNKISKEPWCLRTRNLWLDLPTLLTWGLCLPDAELNWELSLQPCRAFWEDWAVMISGPVTQQLQGISPPRDPIIGLHRTAQKASWSCVCRRFSDHSLPSRSRWWKETSLIEYAELAKTGWLDHWLGTLSIDYAYMPPPRQYYCAL